MNLIFEISSAVEEDYVKKLEGDINEFIPIKYKRKKPPNLPQIGEQEVVRHFINLSILNYHIDKGIYPLGSCTMKYNPKINEDLSSLPGFTAIHPYQPENSTQGAMAIMGELQDMLGELTGFPFVTLQPVAGAHSEMTGLFLMKAFHEKNGNPRKKILVPDSAHGTNPATSSLCGYKVITVPSNNEGIIEKAEIEKLMDDEVAGIMVTNPNTLGLFEKNLKAISEVIHKKGGLVYMDGANLNALLGICKPFELGVDIIHFNLHKTFSTPHGGGGPGGGGLGIVEKLRDFLPTPIINRKDNVWFAEYDLKNSIGPVHSFYGNFNVMVKAYTYIKRIGINGLKKVSETAIINANYIKESLKDKYKLFYKSICMHEVVLSGDFQKEKGVKTLDIAKALLDKGYHAPTVYFPLIVSEALMIEPTETESKETIDSFINVMKEIDEEINSNPEKILSSPINTPVNRLDEALAARQLKVRYEKE